MTKEDQTIAHLNKLKSVYNGSYGADIDIAIRALKQEPILDKIGVDIIKASVEDYKYHGCGTDELIIETSEVLQIIDKYRSEGEEKHDSRRKN